MFSNYFKDENVWNLWDSEGILFLRVVKFVWRSEKGWFILATLVLSSRSTLASDLGCVTLATVHRLDIPEHRRTQEGRPGGCTLEAVTHRCEAP